jgi:hypothetical protein
VRGEVGAQRHLLYLRRGRGRGGSSGGAPSSGGHHECSVELGWGRFRARRLGGGVIAPLRIDGSG